MGNCFHCGLPVLEPGRHRAAVLGAERAFCCAGCEAVARAITGAGFERYYEARSSAGVRPDALPPPALYDDPAAQREFVAAPREHVREATLLLDRIRCAACLWLNERALRRVPGVLRADVNFATQRASIAWDPRVTQLSRIVEAIRAVGYDAYPFDPRRGDALARADVSVAMGAGADAAQLQADVVLSADRLGALEELLAISRRAMRLVRQNLGWALAYNAVALPAAALGWIGSWEAALGMSASSFIVVLNALRPLAKERTWKSSTSSSPSRSLSYS